MNKKLIIFIVVDVIIFFTIAGILLAKQMSQPKIPISTSIEQKGNELVVTVTAKNNSDSTIKRKISIYLQDHSRNRHFVGMVDVELKPGENGVRQSSKKLTEAGPPPHLVIAEWN